MLFVEYVEPWKLEEVMDAAVNTMVTNADIITDMETKILNSCEDEPSKKKQRTGVEGQ